MVTVHTLIDEKERFLNELRHNKNRFRDFLGSMAAHYRQPIERQIALFFHAPAAGRAYADEALWQRLGARLQEGAEGVPVLNEDGSSVSYVYDLSETQNAESPQFRRLVWTFDAEKDTDALRKVFGGETEKPVEDIVVDGMSRLKEQGFGELEILGATYLVLERLGMDAEEHIGLSLILAPYENVDAEHLLGDIQRAAMTVLDPLAKEIRAREQRDEERTVSEYEGVFGERDDASDGASADGAASAREDRAGERRDLQSDGAVWGDDVPVSGGGAVSGGGSAVRTAESGDDRRGSAAGDSAGTDGGSGTGGRETVHSGTVGADSEDVSPIVSTGGVAADVADGGSGAASAADTAGDGDALSDDVPTGGGAADSGTGSQGAGGDSAQPDDRSTDHRDLDGRPIQLDEGNDSPAIDLSSIDYEADMSTTSGKRAVFQRNLAAILALKNVEREGRAATPEEQRLLQSYSGFGGLSEAFDPANKAWANEYDALLKYLTNEEYRSARSSILDAYYTPPEIAEAIYEGLRHIGFTHGNILEPSCGAGRFFSAMPDDIRSESNICGVELDSLSARIAAAAHPDVNVASQGFETTRFADGSFDLAVGNVPFGDTPITGDPKYGGAALLPHDYFLMKMIDDVRSGGLVAAITSSGTMDKLSERTRAELAERADLVTAIRLPSTTFEGAGASVMSDILIFRKKGGERTPVESHTRVVNDAYWWKSSRQVERLKGTPLETRHAVNEYFSQHYQDHVLGRWEEQSGRYGTELSVVSDTNNLRDKIVDVFKELPQNSVYLPPETPLPLPVQAKEPDARAMGFYIAAGELVFIDTQGVESTPELDEKTRARVISAVHLRDAGHNVLEVQQRNGSNEELRQAQKVLNDLYESHIKSYGHIAGDRTLANVFYADPGYNFIRAYEIKDAKGNFVAKADIFTERTILPEARPENADTPEDALVISIQQKGEVDLAYMSELCGIPVREITDELEFTHLYFDDRTKTYIQADEYLSGNIRAKIDDIDELTAQIRGERDSYLAQTYYPQQFSEIEEGVPQVMPEPQNEMEEGLRDILQQLRQAGRAQMRANFRAYVESIDQTKYPEWRTSVARYALHAMHDLDGGFGWHADWIPESLRNDCALGFQLLRRDPKYFTHTSSQHFTDVKHAFDLYQDQHPEQSSGTNKRTFIEDLHDPVRRLSMLHMIDTAQRYLVVCQAQGEKPQHAELVKLYEQAALEHNARMTTHRDEQTELWDMRLERAQKNRDALMTVLPQDVEIGEISVGLGTSWLKPAYVEQFIQSIGLREVHVDYVEETSSWKVTKTERLSYQLSAETQYSAGGKTAYDLIEQCLNQRNAQVRVPIAEGSDQTVVDPELTTQAQMKQQELRDKFRSWLLSDPARVKEIQEYYNRRFNSVRLREFDGSKLTFPGMTNTISLKPHQKDAIAHSLFGGNTLFAHCVGAGKTFEMIASIMESKRMGLSHKALMVVPNHLTAQTGEEFQRLYPRAKILVAQKKDFEKKNRQEFISRIATQNWDAVIIGASSFEKIKLSAERETAMRQRAIDELEDKLFSLRANGAHAKDFSVRNITKLITNQKNRLKKLEQSNRKGMDDVITFEELGVDKLVIDEAHEFKNLEVMTRHARVAGVGTTDHVQKTWDLYMKTQYINEITQGRGLIFATGTPISNAMTEIYTMQRYLAPDRLKELGLESFDAWAAAFTDITVSMELKPEGRGYQLKERFSNFRNLPELMTSFKSFADVRTADMLGKDVIVPTADIIVDKAPASEEQKGIIGDLVTRADDIRRKNPQDVLRVDGTMTKDSMLLITHAGRALSLDPRLVVPEAADEPDSKVNRCVKNLLETYRATSSERGTQILFCDESTSTGAGKGGFNVYDDIREKLIQNGIPREEIAVVQEVSDKDKQKLFDKVRSGEVRVLIGSTGTLGVGTNVQDRLAALHDLSVPWRPADLEQRMGRIVRPGNRYDKVKIFRYVTEGTFDAYLWQTVENKQKQIAQVMTSRSPLRTLQDMDETVLSYAELKAVATGNPFLREKMELENRLGRIQIAKIDYESTRQKLQKFTVIDGPARIKEQDAKIAGLMDDKLCMDSACLQNEQGEELFQMTLCGKLVTDRSKAADILHKVAKGGFSATKDFSGEYRGLKLQIRIDPIAMQPYIILTGKRSHRIGFSDKPEVTMRRISSLYDGIVKELCQVQEERARIAADVKDAEEEIKKPFPHAAEEAEKKARLIEITKQMEVSSEEAIAARGARRTQPTAREERQIRAVCAR